MAAKSHDGSDYKHRQRILPHYQLMALSKKRLKFTLILHMFLAVLMLAKLSSTILDMLNIFFQPIEELYIPMAKNWEWVWLSGTVVALLAFKPIRTNNALQLKLLLLAILATCMLPLIYCAYSYASDFRTYVITRDASKTSEVWRNYPVALYWYVFIGVALQIHCFELYFGWDLLKTFNSNHRASNKNK